MQRCIACKWLTALWSDAGTSADTSISLLMEPAFVSQSGSNGANTSAAAARPPMYFAMPNCTALSDSDRATLAQVGQVGEGGAAVG